MGFYLRKSVRVGPVRFNLSKSGIGMSTGIKGFRVGTGPRGNYVHMGRGGVYYRASLDSGKSPALTAPSSAPRPFVAPTDSMTEIESGGVLGMVDASSAALVEEINEKMRRWQLWPWVGILGFFAIAPSANFHPYAPLAVLVVLAVVVWWISQWDALRVTTVMMYDLDEAATARYQKLHDAFDVLMQAGRVGHIGAQGGVTDRKRNAGAGAVVRRRVIRPHKAPPRRIRTNIEVPAVPVGRQTLHFFPDRVLVVEPAAVGAVPYEQLRISPSDTRFIENDGVPSDAKVVGRTWQYVNKGGGPDKRFKNNRELPIALYEEIHFTSASGLNEVIQVSRGGTGASLESARQALVLGSESTTRVRHDGPSSASTQTHLNAAVETVKPDPTHAAAPRVAEASKVGDVRNRPRRFQTITESDVRMLPEGSTVELQKGGRITGLAQEELTRKGIIVVRVDDAG